MGTVEGAAAGAVLGGGASVLAAALSSIGIPKDSAIRYETAVMADKYLLIAQAVPPTTSSEPEPSSAGARRPWTFTTKPNPVLTS